MIAKTDDRQIEVKQFDQVGEVEVVRRWFFNFFSDTTPQVFVSIQAEPKNSIEMDREPDKKWQVDFEDVPSAVKSELKETLEKDAENFKEQV